MLRKTLIVVLAASAVAFAAGHEDLAAETQGPGRGMGMMGRSAASSDHFTDSNACALCHSAATTATALWSPTGDDVSPHGTWKATMMANSFRDPYWRAQVSKEVAAASTDEKKAEIQALCVTCHGPAVHHEARLAGKESPGVFASYGNGMAEDGVTCTVCHQAQGETFGEPASFSGNLDIRPGRKIFGPYENPSARPMLMHTGFEATHGPHIRDAGLCGSCHTLYTHHVPGGAPFAEQTPYLEWQNSAFADGGSEGARTCQECHMPEVGEMRIARNPAGFDFNIPVRDDYRAHTFVGGNAFMLDLLRRNSDELGVKADADALRRNARATRRQLAHETVALSVVDAERGEGVVSFDVRVENKTGHKFPTGYPARRAWLRVQVRAGRSVIFDSGAFDENGRLEGVQDERGQPHHVVIDDASQVQVYEAVAGDEDGAPTTYLTRMASRLKDNRILPRGYRADGPYAADTAPAGVGDDPDFTGGEDRTCYRVALPDGVSGSGVVVVAWMHYQSVPPAWVDPLRDVQTEEAERFVRMYDAADKAPETVGVTVHVFE
ncbi:MAG: hypothetical protein O3C51_00330 [Planctomycetota bacterium]|nr:hypothetical protein [Planctomycetota bacterium]MDA1221186.1 hypothetical protein [Planctomycetota bacterium]